MLPPQIDDKAVDLSRVQTAADLADCLETIRVLADLSYRQMVQIARDKFGKPLSKTKIGQVLGGQFPNREFLITFLQVCGVPEVRHNRWVATWNRLAMRYSARRARQAGTQAGEPEQLRGDAQAEANEILRRAHDEAQRIVKRAHDKATEMPQNTSSPRARIRVHELADELGVTSQQILGQLMELGTPVQRISSTLTKDQVREVRATFAERATIAAGGPVVPGMTARQSELIRLLANGMTDQMIGERTQTSVRTVRREIAAMMNAFGATSRFAFGVAVTKRGWL